MQKFVCLWSQIYYHRKIHAKEARQKLFGIFAHECLNTSFFRRILVTCRRDNPHIFWCVFLRIWERSCDSQPEHLTTPKLYFATPFCAVRVIDILWIPETHRSAYEIAHPTGAFPETIRVPEEDLTSHGSWEQMQVKWADPFLNVYDSPRQVLKISGPLFKLSW